MQQSTCAVAEQTLESHWEVAKQGLATDRYARQQYVDNVRRKQLEALRERSKRLTDALLGEGRRLRDREAALLENSDAGPKNSGSSRQLSEEERKERQRRRIRSRSMSRSRSRSPLRGQLVQMRDVTARHVSLLRSDLAVAPYRARIVQTVRACPVTVIVGRKRSGIASQVRISTNPSRSTVMFHVVYCLLCV